MASLASMVGLAVGSVAACVALCGVADAHDQSSKAEQLPEGFVYLRYIDPSIEQDIRYAGARNFTGKPVPGYEAEECILLRETALALKRAQSELNGLGFRLKVYDCYRPARAVSAFVDWAQSDHSSSVRHHPHVARSRLIELGYISEKSQHSTGAAVDLTIVALSADRQPRYDPTDDYDVCTATKPRREPDNSEDAGTGFDCFDPASHTGYPALSSAQHAVRKLMVEVLSRHGFANYAGEWWHFRFTFAERPLRMHDFVVRRPGL